MKVTPAPEDYIRQQQEDEMNKQDEELLLTEGEIWAKMDKHYQGDEILKVGRKVAQAQLAKDKQHYEAVIKQTIKDDADRCSGYMESAIKEAKKQERERIFADIKQHTISKRPIKDAVGWIRIALEYRKDYWQALKGEK